MRFTLPRFLGSVVFLTGCGMEMPPPADVLAASNGETPQALLTPPTAEAAHHVDPVPASLLRGARQPAQAWHVETWAHHADAVSVVGSFNGWSSTANPMRALGNGHFTADIPNARPHDEYLFAITRGARTQLKRDPRARQLVNSAGNCVVVDPQSYVWQHDNVARAARDSTIVYEMHVGTFHDVPGGRPGTFASAAEKLPHVAALGATAVEVMPMMEFSGDFSWGYNPAYPFAPESAYGTPEDFKAFVDTAHGLGLRVILDVVFNHFGPADISMWCFDLDCLGTGNGGAFFYTGDMRETGWGPRPDYGRQEVRDFIRDNVAMWLKDYHVDGFRFDSTVAMRNGPHGAISDAWWLLQDINTMVNTQFPNALTIAEDLQNNAWLTRDTGAGGAGFDAQWDAQFFHPVDDAIIAAWDQDRNMDALRAAITASYGSQHPSRVIYTESHDEVANGRKRVPEMISPGHADSLLARQRSTLGAVLVMTSPGMPMVFQGQELLEDGWFTDTNPLDWTRAERFSGVVALYSDLMHLRGNATHVTNGLKSSNVNVFHVNNTAKVLAWHRWMNGGAHDDVVVLANFSARSFTSYTIGLPRGGSWKVRLDTADTRYGADLPGRRQQAVDAHAQSRDGLAFSATLALAPYTALILSQD